MYTIISIFIVIAAILLILIVLAQNPKGGGLASNFAGSNQFMGVRKTADFLEKATWTLALSIVVLSFLATVSMPKAKQGEEQRSEVEAKMNNTPAPDATPAFPMPTQQGQPGDSTK